MSTLGQDDFERVTDPEIARILRSIHAGQQVMLERFDQIDKRVVLTEAAVVSFRKAFPGGDTEGHRHYHETMMLMIEEKRRLRTAIMEKTISGLVWAACVGLGLAVWHYIKEGMRL